MPYLLTDPNNLSKVEIRTKFTPYSIKKIPLFVLCFYLKQLYAILFAKLKIVAILTKFDTIVYIEYCLENFFLFK